ncbi:MAG: HEPN domain-containing protein [Candidatus Aenigmatarchaeota archaeon]
MEEKLLERAKKFLKEAEDDIKKEFYDLAIFHLE